MRILSYELTKDGSEPITTRSYSEAVRYRDEEGYDISPVEVVSDSYDEEHLSPQTDKIIAYNKQYHRTRVPAGLYSQPIYDNHGHRIYCS